MAICEVREGSTTYSVTTLLSTLVYGTSHLQALYKLCTKPISAMQSIIIISMHIEACCWFLATCFLSTCTSLSKNSPTYTTRYIHVTMYRYRASTCSIKSLCMDYHHCIVQGHKTFSHWLVRYLVRVQANCTPCSEATIACNYIPLNSINIVSSCRTLQSKSSIQIFLQTLESNRYP